MVSGRLMINNQEVMVFRQLPKEFKQFEKEVKRSLIQFGTINDFDYDNDAISLEYDLGDGFFMTCYKTKTLKV